MVICNGIPASPLLTLDSAEHIIKKGCANWFTGMKLGTEVDKDIVIYFNGY